MSTRMSIVTRTVMLTSAIAAIVVVVLRRRRPAQVEPAESVEQVEPDPGEDDFGFLLDVGEQQTGPVFDVQDLEVVDVASPLRYDPHREAVLQQMLDLRGGRQQQWRTSRSGHVVQLSEGREALVLQRAIARPTAQQALSALIDQRAAVTERLGGAAPAIALAWPEQAVVGFENKLEGYVAPALADDFVTELGRRDRVVRTLPIALGGKGKQNHRLAGEERLELVRLVTSWISAMHRSNVVHGAIDLHSVAFSTDPLRIAALDYTSARVLGSGPFYDADAATPAISSLDADRESFAKMAFHLLVPEAGGDMSRFMSIPGNLPGLSHQATRRLQRLWVRANGYKGAVPTMLEWAEALGAPQVDVPAVLPVEYSAERDGLDPLADQPEEQEAAVGAGGDDDLGDTGHLAD
jgi:hypothetical protein